jgi:hypothetical protein
MYSRWSRSAVRAQASHAPSTYRAASIESTERSIDASAGSTL